LFVVIPLIGVGRDFSASEFFDRGEKGARFAV
jgi:hypothetical protein